MNESPIVTVEHGALRGKVVTTENRNAFFSFQGIPYAKPPVGPLRFQAPQPAESWDGVRDATTEGNVSAQPDMVTNEYKGDEDCLFLNVFSPKLDGESLPVMVYVHGGGYKWGSGNTDMYGPDYLVEGDVVVVTVNYRCGALGFLCLNTPEVPGNAGIKDVVQAIRWIKNNIKNFGGNPDDITLFGESAGAVTTAILTGSPITKDLINKAIIQSGTGLSDGFFTKNPVKLAKLLAKHLGRDTENVNEVLDVLRAASAKDIVEAYDKIHHPLSFFDEEPMVISPVVEKEFPGVEAVLTESFTGILTSGRTANIPVMIGITNVEFPMYFDNDDISTLIPKELNLARDSEEMNDVVKKIKKFYFKSGEVDKDNLEEFYGLMSDVTMNVYLHRHVQYLIQNSSKPVYYYNFNYIGQFNISAKIFNIDAEIKHAAHTDELGYIFKNIYQDKVQATPQDIKMRERMVRLWTNFAKTGNPTPEQNHFLTVTWLPATVDNVYYMDLAQELSLKTDLNRERMIFWDDLYSKYYKIWEQQNFNDQEFEKIAPNNEVLANGLIMENKSYPDESKGIINSTGKASKAVRTSNEIKMVSQTNGIAKDVIRANDPPEDDLPKDIGVNKFVNFFNSLGK